jgi:hypothetical protein
MRKTALITGGAGGIGLELAKILCQHDHNVILVDFRADELQKSVALLSDSYPDMVVTGILQDLATQDAATRLFEKVKSMQWDVDVLINNAGFGIFGYFKNTDWERENRMLTLHVFTLTQLTKLFLTIMVKQGNGSILNVASVAAFQPSPLMAVYNASKAYILSFSEAIAQEVKGTGVQVSVLCPGLTRTEFQATVGGRPTFQSSKLMGASAEAVARKGFEAMMRGKTVIIPGLVNYLLANASRFVPRDFVAHQLKKAQLRNRNLKS